MFKNYQIRSGIDDYTNIKEILQLSKHSFLYVKWKDKDKDKEFLFPMQQVSPLLQRQDRGQ